MDRIEPTPAIEHLRKSGIRHPCGPLQRGPPIAKEPIGYATSALV